MKLGLLLLLTFYAGQSFGQKWISLSLNDRVKVDFPRQPDTQDTGNIKMFQIAETDYIINVGVNVMPQNVRIDPKQDDIVIFYKRVIQGALEAATNSKLLYESKIEIDGFEGREIAYTKDFNGATGILVKKRILLVDRVLFIFDVWDLAGKGQEKLIRKFFKSIDVL